VAELNPYLPPKTRVGPVVEPSRWSLIATAGCAELGALIGLTYLPVGYELVHVGALAPLFLVATVVSTLSLLVGGVLTILRKRKVAYLLAMSCVFALLASVYWTSVFTIAHAVFATLTAVQGFYVLRPLKKNRLPT